MRLTLERIEHTALTDDDNHNLVVSGYRRVALVGNQQCCAERGRRSDVGQTVNPEVHRLLTDVQKLTEHASRSAVEDSTGA
jgi:hypothetical protein